MSTATVDPKVSLDFNQRSWLKRMGAALDVNLQSASPPTTAPSSPDDRAQDVATRQGAAVDVAMKEWEKQVRESGAANRGKQVDEYARNAGFNPNTDYNDKVEGVQGIEWCGAFAGYALTQSGFKDAPYLASYQKARDYFVYRSYTAKPGSGTNEKLDQLRADQEASGSSREYFLLEGSDSNMAKLAKQPGKYGKEKYAHYDADKNTFNYQNLPIQPGDVALFNHGHVGLVKSYDPSTGILETVEGNAGGELASGKKVGSDAVVKNKYDLSTEKDRKKFDGFGRPSAGDFKDTAAPSSGPSGGGSSGADPAKPSAKPAANKRTVPGGGGYVYEQHSDGKIFIVQSPRHGKTHFLVKDRKGYDAILAEIGPFPASPDVPGSKPKPASGTNSASSFLDDLFDAVQDVPGRIEEAAKGIVGGIGDQVDRIADVLGGKQSAAPNTAIASPAGTPATTGAANQPAQDGNATQTAGADAYRSQTDNPELAGGTCNVTTLAMQLLTLADGDETKLREEAVQLLKDRNVNAKTDTQLEELLRQLTIKEAGAKQIKLGKSDVLHNAWEVAWVLDKVSELFTGYVSKTETIYPGTNQKGFEDKIVPAVQQGAAVMLANYLTSAGHIVKLNSVLSDGIVIDDPNGCLVASKGSYLANGATISATLVKRIQDNSKVLDERLKRNSSLRQELTDLAKAGKGKIPANAGKLNFYSWAEVGTYEIGKWANITYKK